MLHRTILVLVLVWLFGFAWFAVTPPRPHPGGRTDAVIVLTGGAGRIEHGLATLARGQARQILVSGVDRQVLPAEFATRYAVPARLMRCCVTLGFDAFDTRSNAREAVRWIAAHHFSSVRVVTSDWHMRRARLELGRTLPSGIVTIEDAVPSHPTRRMLFLEYNKLLVRLAQAWWAR